MNVHDISIIIGDHCFLAVFVQRKYFPIYDGAAFQGIGRKSNSRCESATVESAVLDLRAMKSQDKTKLYYIMIRRLLLFITFVRYTIDEIK